MICPGSEKHYSQQLNMKATQVPSTDKQNVVYAMNETSALKRKEILTHVTTLVNLEDTPKEVSQSLTDKYCMVDSTFMTYLKWSKLETESRVGTRGGRPPSRPGPRGRGEWGSNGLMSFSLLTKLTLLFNGILV